MSKCKTCKIYKELKECSADVVPKSEVEELKAIIADHKASEERLEEIYSNAKAEVAREIFAEIWKCMEHDYISSIDVFSGALGLRIAELKKKYTEQKNG